MEDYGHYLRWLYVTFFLKQVVVVENVKIDNMKKV